MSGDGSMQERFEVGEGDVPCDVPGFRRGRDVQTGETVAIRLVLTPDEASVARFEYEAAIRAMVRHPFVLRYLAHGPWGAGARYLAVEWLEGEMLSARLARGPLSVEESLQLCHRLAEVLCTAHGAGISHRGIAPESVFLAGGALTAPRVIDFGDRVSDANSPRGFDPSADIHSLGRLWFLALTGQPAGTVTSARSLRDEVPPGADELLERMLSTFQPERPADARAVLAAIATVRHTGRWNVGASSAPPPAQNRAAATALANPMPPPAWEPVPESGAVARARETPRDARTGAGADSDAGQLDLAEASDLRAPNDAASDALPTLQRLFNDCVANRRARVVLLTSDRAMEASRAAASLAYSLPVRRTPEIWLMRADASSERDRFGVLSALVRQLAGIGPADSSVDRVRKLRERIKRRVSRDAHIRLTGYLGQLARVPIPAQELGSACGLINDPQRLDAAMERAWVEFVGAESTVQPVLLVLDAMHLMDPASLEFVETSVRELADRPFMVLGLAHPRVRARFPNAFHGCELQEIFGRTHGRPSGERLQPGTAQPARAGEER